MLEFFFRIPGSQTERPVCLKKLRFERQHRDAHGRGVEHTAEAFFTLPERLLGSFALGNVDDHVNPADNVSFFIAQRSWIRREPKPAAIRALADTFRPPADRSVR